MKPFDILVWGIVSIVLIFVVISIYSDLIQEPTLTDQIKIKLEEAESPIFLGEVILVNNTDLRQDQLLLRNSFEIEKKSIALECTTPKYCCPIGEECSKSIEWDNQRLKVKKTITTDVFVRCIKVESLPVCKIYVGDKPAQASIKEINLTSQSNNSNNFELIVTNIGKQNLTFGKSNVELYKKVNNTFEKIDEFFPTQEIAFLPVNTNHTFIWNIITTLPGEYRAKFIFSGENGGFTSMNYDFNSEFNENCSIDTKQETFEIEDPELIKQGFYDKEYYYCNNCNYSYECLAVWSEKYPDVNYNIETKERVSCYSISAGSSCNEETNWN